MINYKRHIYIVLNPVRKIINQYLSNWLAKLFLARQKMRYVIDHI